ncbi:hypothetical protein Q8G35_02490 [Peribacillus simplex]|uniref:GNAT family N-acetyltransferase n=2 Tax=Peribacillus TaxID=2675229 RepID=A0AA90P0A0_9BACI|nr:MULTISPECIES: hypothetical protein [Peribacillus]MDP1417271.1 hypothetical protein [Peribacillus simplex]MDP1449926.1 hypothetical protein [Peribacillus frigoritolerans]
MEIRKASRKQSRTNEIQRLELSVIANKAPALSLYRKIGFEKKE